MDEGEELIRWCEQTGYDVTNKCRQPDSLNHDVILQYVATHDVSLLRSWKENKMILDLSGIKKFKIILHEKKNWWLFEN